MRRVVIIDNGIEFDAAGYSKKHKGDSIVYMVTGNPIDGKYSKEHRNKHIDAAYRMAPDVIEIILNPKAE